MDSLYTWRYTCSECGRKIESSSRQPFTVYDKATVVAAHKGTHGDCK